MMRKWWTLCMLGLLLLTFPAGASNESNLLVGYLYAESFQSQEDLAAIDFTKLTHVNFAFAGLNEETYLPELNDRAQQKLWMLKEELNRQGACSKVILSIGGWGCRGFCYAAEDEAHRKAFAQECLRLVEHYGLDGVDIDWEYPVNGAWGQIDTLGEADRTNYTLLLQEIRNALGTEYFISIAFAPQAIDLIEAEKVGQICDLIHLMAYDYDSYAHASLETTERYLPEWLEAVQARKLTLGVPFYSRSGAAEYNGLSYRKIKALQVENGWEVTVTQGDSCIWTEQGRISFDSPEVLMEKAIWARGNGLAGVMIWELGQDDGSELLRALAQAL